MAAAYILQGVIDRCATRAANDHRRSHTLAWSAAAFLRPPNALPRREGMVFLLVGLTLLFSGYDLNVFSLALPQIQKHCIFRKTRRR